MTLEVLEAGKKLLKPSLKPEMEACFKIDLRLRWSMFSLKVKSSVLKT